MIIITSSRMLLGLFLGFHVASSFSKIKIINPSEDLVSSDVRLYNTVLKRLSSTVFHFPIEYLCVIELPSLFVA